MCFLLKPLLRDEHGKTIIMAAHAPRLSTIADQVVAMNEGKITSVTLREQATEKSRDPAAFYPKSDMTDVHASGRVLAPSAFSGNSAGRTKENKK